jgi:hypothetical protein
MEPLLTMKACAVDVRRTSAAMTDFMGLFI